MARATRPKTAALLTLCVLLPAALSGVAQAAESAEAWRLCAEAVARAESQVRMPQHLLTAVSRVESGRWRAESGEILAWPWTVTAGGEGRFLPSKAAAVAEVEALQARGLSNIDVGCMQINLHYHPEAFDSLEEAFDPAANVGYAVDFLTGLRERWGSWTRAVGNYHSNTPELSGRYRAKIFQAVYEAKREAVLDRRAERARARSEAHSESREPADATVERETAVAPGAATTPASYRVSPGILILGDRQILLQR